MAYLSQDNEDLIPDLITRKEFYWFKRWGDTSENKKYEDIIPRFLLEDAIARSGNLKLMSYQMFVQNYINPNTPYKRLLMQWDTGTGKSIGALSIAMNFIQQYRMEKEIGHVEIGSVFIIGFSERVFKNELLRFPEFGFLSKEERYRLDKLKRLAAVGGKPDIDRYQDMVIKIKKRFTSRKGNGFFRFYGYKAFVNRIFKAEKGINLNDLSEEQIRVALSNGKITYDEDLLSQFKNSLIICDEIHNVYNSVEKNNWGIAVQAVLDREPTCRAVLMSATPLNNSPTEIIDLLNLLLPAEQRLDKRDFFDNEKTLKPGALDKIGNLSSGRVSFLRDVNPKYYPSLSVEGEDLKEIPYLKFIRCPMSEFHYRTYKQVYTGALSQDSQYLVDFALENPDPTSKIGIFQTNQIKSALIAAPQKWKDKYGFDFRDNRVVGDALKYENLKKYSTKYVKMLDEIFDVIYKKNGKIFIYHDIVHMSGVLFIEQVLLKNGFIDEFSSSSDNTICMRCGRTRKEHSKDEIMGSAEPDILNKTDTKNVKLVFQKIKEKIIKYSVMPDYEDSEYSEFFNSIIKQCDKILKSKKVTAFDVMQVYTDIHKLSEKTPVNNEMKFIYSALSAIELNGGAITDNIIEPDIQLYKKGNKYYWKKGDIYIATIHKKKNVYYVPAAGMDNRLINGESQSLKDLAYILNTLVNIKNLPIEVQVPLYAPRLGEWLLHLHFELKTTQQKYSILRWSHCQKKGCGANDLSTYNKVKITIQKIPEVEGGSHLVDIVSTVAPQNSVNPFNPEIKYVADIQDFPEDVPEDMQDFPEDFPEDMPEDLQDESDFIEQVIEPTETYISSNKPGGKSKHGDKHKFIPARYIIAHSEIEKSQMEHSLEKFNNSDNADGNRFMILIASKIMKESYDIKAIQNVFIMGRPANIPTLLQIRGRAIRKHSHKDLPPDKRVVRLKIFTSCLPEKQTIGVDKGKYKLSYEEEKYKDKIASFQVMQKIEKVLHEHAIDGFINHELIQRAARSMPDPLSSLEFTPKLDPKKINKHFHLSELNLSTFNIYHAKKEVDLIKTIIKRLFIEISSVWEYNDLLEAVKNPGDYETEINTQLFSEGNFLIAMDQLCWNNDTQYIEPLISKVHIDSITMKEILEGGYLANSGMSVKKWFGGDGDMKDSETTRNLYEYALNNDEIHGGSAMSEFISDGTTGAKALIKMTGKTSQFPSYIIDRLYDTNDKIVTLPGGQDSIILPIADGSKQYYILFPISYDSNEPNIDLELPYRVVKQEQQKTINMNNFIQNKRIDFDYDDKKKIFYRKYQDISIENMENVVCEYGTNFHIKFLEECVDYVFRAWIDPKIEKSEYHEFYFKMLYYYDLLSLVIWAYTCKPKIFRDYVKYAIPVKTKDVKLKTLSRYEKRREELEDINPDDTSELATSGIINLLKTSLNRTSNVWIPAEFREQYQKTVDDSLRLFAGKYKKTKSISKVSAMQLPIGHYISKFPRLYHPDKGWTEDPTYSQADEAYIENNIIIGYDDRSAAGVHIRFKLRPPVHNIKKYKDSRLIARGTVCKSKSKSELRTIAKNLDIMLPDKMNVDELCGLIRSKLIRLELKERIKGSKVKYFYHHYEDNTFNL